MTNNNASHGVIWITGYSAAGKTTVSRKVESELKKLNCKTIYLDGDDLRAIFGNHGERQPDTLKEKDIADIEADMAKKVLHPDKYPTASFSSKSI